MYSPLSFILVLLPAFPVPITPSVEDVEAPALAAAYEEKEASEEFRRYAQGDGPADDGP